MVENGSLPSPGEGNCWGTIYLRKPPGADSTWGTKAWTRGLLTWFDERTEENGCDCCLNLRLPQGITSGKKKKSIHLHIHPFVHLHLTHPSIHPCILPNTWHEVSVGPPSPWIPTAPSPRRLQAVAKLDIISKKKKKKQEQEIWHLCWGIVPELSSRLPPRPLRQKNANQGVSHCQNDEWQNWPS